MNMAQRPIVDVAENSVAMYMWCVPIHIVMKGLMMCIVLWTVL